MSDPGIFIYGCGVFGLALAATIASIIGTSQPINNERDVPDNDAAEDETTVHEFTSTAGDAPKNRKAG
jgi:hypothetical protein